MSLRTCPCFFSCFVCLGWQLSFFISFDLSPLWAPRYSRGNEAIFVSPLLVGLGACGVMKPCIGGFARGVFRPRTSFALFVTGVGKYVMFTLKLA